LKGKDVTEIWIYLLMYKCLQCFDAVGWGDRKGIRPVKKLEWWGTGMVISLERDADLHNAQQMPLPPTVSCFSKIQIGFTFLVPAYSGSPGKRAVKRVCVCVCVLCLSLPLPHDTLAPDCCRSHTDIL